MKYKVGDRVLIKSLDWYNENKGNADKTNSVWCEDGGAWFFYHMSQHCGKIMTIKNVWALSYTLEGSDSRWTDEMIEGLVEESDDFDKMYMESEERYEEEYSKGEYCHEQSFKWGFQEGYDYAHENEKLEINLKNGYQFVDENGNVINATKIVLEKKKKEYPKTYEECCKILDWNHRDYDRVGYKSELLCKLQVLILCRDAYWKIAGEEMGLGKPWKPDWNTSEPKYVIAYTSNGIEKQWETTYCKVFAFPTEEMRDAFYENFKSEIEICKELL